MKRITLLILFAILNLFLSQGCGLKYNLMSENKAEQIIAISDYNNLDVSAKKQVYLDDFEDINKTKTLWQQSEVTIEVSPEHVTSGRNSLKITFPKKNGSILFERKQSPEDWSRYKTLCFDIYNPNDFMVPLGVRIDDADAGNFKDRFEPVEDIYLPPKTQKAVHINIDLLNLLTNETVRLMDTSKIIRFVIYSPGNKGPLDLYLDSVCFLELPEQDRPKAAVKAKEAVFADDFTDEAKTAELWKGSTAKFELSKEQGPSLKTVFPAGEGGLRFGAERSFDWSGYGCLSFSMTNTSKKIFKFGVVLNDVNSTCQDDRFSVDDLVCPPEKTENYKINIYRPVSRCGLRMDPSRLKYVAFWTAGSKDETIVLLSDMKLLPEPAGMKNDLHIGKLPGMDAEKLGKLLLEDPEIKPLIPIFKAMPPKKMAFLAHSAGLTGHWSTSAGFFDIACEAVRAVNPGFEHKGFYKGGMRAGAAVQEFLKDMKEYKPTDTYMLVVPEPMSAQKKLVKEMVEAGSKVYVFDAVKPWGAYSEQMSEQLRKLCLDNGAVYLELMARGYGAPSSPRWLANDGIHMMTVGHIHYARELLKEWAIIYAPAQTK